ncbi:MAG: tetratricopeptide repeat protein [Deferribacteres bacterium]|nr:tetratricopeptide repeat protein [candidate division KSB1 bacterium]MCB9501901.1 tetratricopeptide repeat protein [Deferribacteres bacterium]
MRLRNHHRAIIPCIFILLMSMQVLAGDKLTLTTGSEEAKQAFLEGVRLLENQQFQHVLPEAEKAIEADSNFAMAIMLKSSFIQQNDQRTPMLEKALTKKMSDGERKYIHAMLVLRQGDNQGSLDEFTALRKAYPGDRMVQMMYAQLHMILGNLDEALAGFKDAEKIDNTTTRAKTLIGNCAILTGKYDKARQIYKEVISLSDPDASPFFPFFGMAWADIYEGKHANALKIYDEYLDRYNRNGAAQGFPPVWIWNQIARVNLELGDANEALRCYDIGYKSVPPTPDAQVDSTQKLVWLGRMKHGKARTLAKLGRFEEADAIVADVKKMIDEGGKEAEQYIPAYHYLAGYVELERQNWPAAVEHLEKADATNTFHVYLLAKAYYKNGQIDKAREKFQAVVDSKTNNVERALSYPEAVKMLAKLGTN